MTDDGCQHEGHISAGIRWSWGFGRASILPDPSQSPAEAQSTSYGNMLMLIFLLIVTFNPKFYRRPKRIKIEIESCVVGLVTARSIQ